MISDKHIGKSKKMDGMCLLLLCIACTQSLMATQKVCVQMTLSHESAQNAPGRATLSPEAAVHSLLPHHLLFHGHPLLAPVQAAVETGQ